jgi:hypothetical protein
MLIALAAVCVAEAIVVATFWLAPMPPHSTLSSLDFSSDNIFIAAVFVIICGLLACVQVWRFRKAREKEQAEENIESAQHDDDGTPSAANFQSVVKEIRTYRHAQSRENEGHYFGETVTLFVLIITAGVLFLQWQTLGKTDNTQRMINRAFVYVDQINVIPYPNPPSVYSGWAAISNGGATLATHASVQGGCARAKPDENIDDPFSQLKWDDGIINKVNIVSPKQNFPLPICDFKEPEFTAAVKGEIQLFIRVIVQYRDIFDPTFPRVTERTVKLLADGITYRFAYVGPNNCTDDDCPK